MDEKPYAPKSYKLFVLWVILFFCAMFLSAFLCSEFEIVEIISTKITLSVCMLSLLILMLSIYKSGRIYIFNGVMYEEAKKAGELRRKEYALAHLRIFIRASLIWLAWIVVSLFLKFSFFIDVMAFACDVVVHAIATVKIKL